MQTREHQTETVRAIYEAFGRGDVSDVMARLASDIEWITPPTLPWSQGRYQGPAGVGTYFTSFLEALDAPEIRPDELLAAGDRVIAYGFEHGRARATGKPFRARFVHTWTVVDGKVTRLEGLVDTAAIHAAFS